MVMRWCLQNAFLVSSQTDLQTYHPNITSDANDFNFRAYIFSFNLKALCHEHYYDEMLSFLQDTAYDHVVSRLLDLYIQVTTEIDPMFLNLYVGKLEYSLTLIGTDTPEIPWSRIFNKHPYIWLLFIIQSLMREHVVI
ncbi:unnamed protein product [Sphagnum jensenii]|uniref:Uncharacterized protein n=1 Tax=Sphagnum jensenii TaxID=128206 RepID=A0ABP0VHU0_9BRYO